MIINISAGHNPDGKVACGAVGLIKESTEARIVKDEVIYQLKKLGHKVYDCTCEDGSNQSNVLTKIVNKHNIHSADLEVSIHFNAGAKDLHGNGKNTGTEVLIYSKLAGAYGYADSISKSIAALGFKNRGVKIRPDLYFLRKTKGPALLIECCFVDDKDDVKLYSAKSMANAIVKGITGKNISDESKKETKSALEANELESFRVKIKVNLLNSRSGPGTEYSVNGEIHDKGVYTIIKKVGNWGLLKSKKGYINISSRYVDRLD